jgi:alpha-maltose-1-phosphate synthase
VCTNYGGGDGPSWRIHILAEGDPESWDSWSGISRSVVTHLRRRGHQVVGGDVDLYRLERLIVALREFSAHRKRWWVKYHLNERPFLRRSRKAAAAMRARGGKDDAVLQLGATFRLPVECRTPVFLYSDGNIALSDRATEGGQSEASFLTAPEIEAVKRREAEVYLQCAHIFTISERLRKSFIEDFGISSERVTTVYAGANVPLQALIPGARRPGGPPSILFVGRDFERKGGDILLSAFERVKAAIPQAELHIVGTSGNTSRSGVTFHGLLDKRVEAERMELEDLFRTSDVFCLPSRYEGLSISFLEAMSFGLPCVGTSSEWSPPEMIVDGETGIVVRMDDAEALSIALIRILQDSSLRERFGAAGHRRLGTMFTWEAVITRMEAVMRQHLALE